jgi:hypothetical protein
MLADLPERKTVVHSHFIVGHLNLNCLVDTGTTFSCVSNQIARSLLSHGSAEDAGSETLAVDTADGRARSRYRIISAKITHPTTPSFSVTERFIVLPKFSTGTVLLGMSFLGQVGCVIDVPQGMIFFRNSFVDQLRPLAIPFAGYVQRSLHLAASNDFVLESFDETCPRALPVQVYAVGSKITADGPVRQSSSAVLNNSLFTVRPTCQLVDGQAQLAFCNLSSTTITIKAGTTIAEWIPPAHTYVITLPDGSILQQEADEDTQPTPSELPPVSQGPYYGDGNLTTEQESLLCQMVERAGSLTPPQTGTFTHSHDHMFHPAKASMTGPTARPYHTSPSDRKIIAGLVAELITMVQLSNPTVLLLPLYTWSRNAGRFVLSWTNAPAIMQRRIDRVLAPHKKYALAYMDDIIVLSPTFEQHLEHASTLLRTLL